MEKPERKCPACSREALPEDSYCDRHSLAYRNLKETFKQWQAAMEVDWETYLREVMNNPNTGSWVKEVAAHVLQKKKS
ncbi:hypothetical protein [Candidatus Hecatella orcuttiae]|uniref:hypothetical protein n=1 Tax=Candidatus Hecatella orcuttiae TaxID=1935119 RepID=UPI0028680DAD|nr:hypothetical protein [Candidatus Hecatella orcuttiae]